LPDCDPLAMLGRLFATGERVRDARLRLSTQAMSLGPSARHTKECRRINLVAAERAKPPGHSPQCGSPNDHVSAVHAHRHR
jgi:hypothetical protein